MTPNLQTLEALEGYILSLGYETGELKLFDLKPYLDHGVFTRLKDLKLFQRVRIAFDTVEWPGGIDLDPEVLYRDGILSQQNLTTESHASAEKSSKTLGCPRAPCLSQLPQEEKQGHESQADRHRPEGKSQAQAVGKPPQD